jgi:hypothetical protein
MAGIQPFLMMQQEPAMNLDGMLMVKCSLGLSQASNKVVNLL